MNIESNNSKHMYVVMRSGYRQFGAIELGLDWDIVHLPIFIRTHEQETTKRSTSCKRGVMDTLGKIIGVQAIHCLSIAYLINIYLLEETNASAQLHSIDL